MSDRETPSRGIWIIFGGLLTLFGGGCVVLWVSFVVSYLNSDSFASFRVLAADTGFLPAIGLAAFALGAVLLRQGLRQSRNDTRKVILGGLLTLFGGGMVVLGLWLGGLGSYVSLPIGLATGLATLALGVPLLRQGLRQRRNDTRKD